MYFVSRLLVSSSQDLHIPKVMLHSRCFLSTLSSAFKTEQMRTRVCIETSMNQGGILHPGPLHSGWESAVLLCRPAECSTAAETVTGARGACKYRRGRMWTLQTVPLQLYPTLCHSLMASNMVSLLPQLHIFSCTPACMHQLSCDSLLFMALVCFTSVNLPHLQGSFCSPNFPSYPGCWRP